MRKSKETSISMIEPLLSVEDVANLLAVSRATIYEYIRREGLPTVQLGGTRRIEPAALAAWIAQHRDTQTRPTGKKEEGSDERA